MKVSIGDIFISGPRKSLTLRKIDPVNRKYSRQEFINIGGRGFWILGAPLKYQRHLYQWKLYFIDSLEKLRHLLNGSHWFNNPILGEKVDIPLYLRTRIKYGKTPSYKYEHECQQWLNMSTKSCLAFFYVLMSYFAYFISCICKWLAQYVKQFWCHCIGASHNTLWFVPPSQGNSLTLIAASDEASIR